MSRERSAKADAALNSTYRQLMSQLKDHKVAIAKLIASERAWVVFRDADLEAMGPVEPNENRNFVLGSAHPMCVSMAFIEMTHERQRNLEERMHHQEGNICSDEIAGCVSKPPSQNSGNLTSAGRK